MSVHFLVFLEKLHQFPHRSVAFGKMFTGTCVADLNQIAKCSFWDECLNMISYIGGEHLNSL